MVVGGGDSAMEEANFLTRFGSEVALVHRRDQFRASKIMLDRVRHNPKIKLLTNTVVEDVFDASQQLVTGVRLKNLATGEVWEQDVDGFFVAIGHIPNTAVFQGADRHRSPTATFFPRAARRPISRVCSTPATCRIAYTGRPSPRRARVAWRPWKPSGISKRRDINDRTIESAGRSGAARTLFAGSARGRFHFRVGPGPGGPGDQQGRAGRYPHETRLVLTNIRRILEGCGASLADVVKCSVFLADGKDFAAMNEVYAEFFGDAQTGPHDGGLPVCHARAEGRDRLHRVPPAALTADVYLPVSTGSGLNGFRIRSSLLRP